MNPVFKGGNNFVEVDYKQLELEVYKRLYDNLSCVRCGTSWLYHDRKDKTDHCPKFIETNLEWIKDVKEMST